MKSYTLNKLPLSSCRIVYGASPIKGSVGSLTGNTVEQDIGRFMQGENRACEFDKQCAEELGRNVAELFGVSLETVCVDDTDLRDGDILVGKVGAVAAPTDERAYVCDTVQVEAGSCFSIVGGSYGATWHAIAALCEYWKAGEVTDLAHGMPKTGLAPLKTVACLGDSITRGSQALPDANGFGTPDGLAASFGGAATSIYFEQFLSYPANLQRSLWKDYLIFNFGRGFSSMRKLCVDASGGQQIHKVLPFQAIE